MFVHPCSINTLFWLFLHLSCLQTGKLTTNHMTGASSNQTARSARPRWRSTLPGRESLNMWAKHSTRARSSSEDLQWTKALCASAFQHLKPMDIKATMCLPYCKNDLEMSNAKEEQDFCLSGPNCFCCDLRNKSIFHNAIYGMRCVWSGFSLKQYASSSFAFVSAEFLKTFHGRSENNLPTSETGCGWRCHVIFNQKG